MDASPLHARKQARTRTHTRTNARTHHILLRNYEALKAMSGRSALNVRHAHKRTRKMRCEADVL